MGVNYTWQAQYGGILLTIENRQPGGFDFEFTDSTTDATVNEYTEETDTQKAQAIAIARAREIDARTSPRSQLSPHHPLRNTHFLPCGDALA
jgi:hypothetical protein